MGQGPHPDISTAPSSGWTQHEVPPKTLYIEATATSGRRPTTWCSTTEGGFISPDLGKLLPRHRDRRRLLTGSGCPTGSRSYAWLPFLRPNGCASIADGKVKYVANREECKHRGVPTLEDGGVRKPKGQAAHSGKGDRRV